MKEMLKRCLALMLVGVFLFGNCSYAATGSLIPNKAVYLLLEKNNLSRMKNAFSEITKNDLLTFLDVKDLSSLQYDAEIYSENISGDWGNLKLKAHDEMAIKDNYRFQKINLLAGNESVVTLESVLNGNLLAARIPELYEKYVSVNLDDLESVCEKLGFDPAQLSSLNLGAQSGSSLRESFNLTEEEEKYLESSFTKYLAQINNLLNSKFFSKESNVVINYNNKSVKCNSASFTISAKDMLLIGKALYKEVKKDDKLLKIIFDKILACDAISYAASNSGESLPTKEEFITEMDALVAEIDNPDNAEYMKDYEKIKFVSTLYYNSKYETLKRDLKFLDENSDESNVISIFTIKDSYYALLTDSYSLEDSIVNQGTSTQHNISITTKRYNYDFDDYYNFSQTEYTDVQNYVVNVQRPTKNEFTVTAFIKDSNDKIIINSVFKTEDSKKASLKMKFTLQMEGQNYNIYLNSSIERDPQISKVSIIGNEFNLNKESKESIEKEISDNQEIISQKAEKIAEKLFPETTKLSNERMQRFTASADTRTGEQIGKAVRIWNVDAWDYDSISRELPSTWTEYSQIDGLVNTYISSGYTPNQLENAKYYVASIKREVYGEKIVVAISNMGGWDLPNPANVVQVTYDGTASGIVYIEM